MTGKGLNENLENIFLDRINKEQLVSRIQNDPKEFEDCVEIAASIKQPQAWRAAWILNHSIEENDVRICKHIPALFQTLKGTTDGHQREILKILNKMELDEDQEGLLFDACMNIWESVGKNPSSRITAFRILSRIANNYPELKTELEFVVQEHYMETLSPAIKVTCQKIWKEFDKSELRN